MVCKNKATLNEDCSFDRFKRWKSKTMRLLFLSYISSATTVTQEGWLMMFDEYKGG